MTLQVLVPPAAEPVTLDEAKAVLRVTDDAEDGLIGRLIRAARQRIEAALGVALMTTTYRETLDLWSDSLAPNGDIRLQRGPLLGVDAIKIANGNGTPETLDPSLYRPRLASRPGLIAPLGAGLPPSAQPLGGLEITYRCGFGDRADTVPEPLRQAVLALVAHSFEHREAADLPLALIEPWLAPFRRVRL
ncbi:MAG: hypothetical protein RJA87_73 [Pseudomonadota bacterium]|jgi:uncharacterized phiE125 gp8 family phage protein